MVLALVAPAMGLEVSPRFPLYHWNVKGPAPVVATDRVDDCPELIGFGEAFGLPLIGAQVTVTVVAALFAGGAHCPVTSTQ